MPKTSTFVPEGYEVNTGSNDFFKFKSGDNKFRILSEASFGLLGWKDNKPFRRGGEFAQIKPTEVDEDSRSGKPKINEFLSFYIYSHNDNKIMIMELTQTSVKKAIVDLARDEDWGDPKEYDITVTKTGDGLNTKYTVKPAPKKPLVKAIQSIVDESAESFDLVKALNIEED